MLNILRQAYNTGALNAAQLFPDESQGIGVSIRNLSITLGAQINNGANAIIYTPQDCHLLNFIVIGNPVANADLAVANGNLLVTAAANLAVGTVIEVMVIEKS